MLGNFIFSLSISLPIFLVMFSGFIFKKKNIINENFITGSNFIVFYIAVPIKIFNSISKSLIIKNIDFNFIIFIIIGSLFSVFIIHFFSNLFIKEKSKIGAFVHGAFRGNFVYVGLSLLENVTGFISPIASLTVAFIIPIYNILGILVLTLNNSIIKGKKQFKSLMINIVTNPLIIGVMLGIAASIIEFELPLLFENTFNYFDSLATPLALLTIGASFKMDKLFVNFKLAISATVIKILINPTIAVLAAFAIGLTSNKIILTYIVFGVPSAISSAIITSAMGGDEDLAASIVMMTTLTSVFSMTLFIFIFKWLGIV